jgi:putative phage-type endonuclease
MIIVDCQQRTPEWHAARLGVITASELKNIITSTGELSKSAETYMFRLLGEFVSGQSEDEFRYQSKYMERGTQYEEEARNYYEFATDRTVQKVGFIYKDERKLLGCSPDGWIEAENEGLEMKAPSAGVHVRYLLKQDVPAEYWVQVQSSLYITGAKSWDWLAYHPHLPSVIINVRPDKTFIRKMEIAVNAFIDKMMIRRQELIERGIKQG